MCQQQARLIWRFTNPLRRGRSGWSLARLTYTFPSAPINAGIAILQVSPTKNRE